MNDSASSSSKDLVAKGTTEITTTTSTTSNTSNTSTTSTTTTTSKTSTTPEVLSDAESQFEKNCRNLLRRHTSDSGDEEWHQMKMRSAAEMLHNGEVGWHERLSEPHSVREDSKTCKVWVALKGETREGFPTGPNDADYTEMYDAMIALNESLPHNHTSGHAVWEIQPADYNRSALPAFGGQLHTALPTPVNDPPPI